jgi:hypothetical protein
MDNGCNTAIDDDVSVVNMAATDTIARDLSTMKGSLSGWIDTKSISELNRRLEQVRGETKSLRTLVAAFQERAVLFNTIHASLDQVRQADIDYAARATEQPGPMWESEKEWDAWRGQIECLQAIADVGKRQFCADRIGSVTRAATEKRLDEVEIELRRLERKMAKAEALSNLRADMEKVQQMFKSDHTRNVS